VRGKTQLAHEFSKISRRALGDPFLPPISKLLQQPQERQELLLGQAIAEVPLSNVNFDTQEH
jgi:hypothetical protein